MAQLPEIGIQPTQFSFPTGTVPSGAELPATIAQFSENLNKQLVYLSGVLKKNRIMMNDKMAVNDFHEQYNNLNEVIAGIKDPKEAEEVHRTGSQDIIDRLHEKYPEMTAYTQQQLMAISAGKDAQFRMANIRREDMNARNDMKSLIQLTNRNAVNLPPDQARALLDSTKQVIVNSPLYTDQQKLNMIDNMETKYREALFERLVSTNPNAILKYGSTPEEFGVSAQKFIQGKNQALSQREHEMTISDMKFKEERMKWEHMAEEGAFGNDFNTLAGLREGHFITPRAYAQAIAQIPPQERPRQLLESVINEINWDSPDDLKEFRNNTILGNPALSSSDKSSLSGLINNRVAELRDPQHKKSHELYYDLKDYGFMVGKRFLARGYPGPEGKQFYDLLALTRDRLYHAKNYDELFKIYKEGETTVEKLFKVNEAPMHRSGTVLNEHDIGDLERVLNIPTPGVTK